MAGCRAGLFPPQIQWREEPLNTRCTLVPLGYTVHLGVNVV